MHSSLTVQRYLTQSLCPLSRLTKPLLCDKAVPPKKHKPNTEKSGYKFRQAASLSVLTTSALLLASYRLESCLSTDC